MTVVRAMFVLSGGPCSGKTTLIHALEAAGHHTVAEAAADIIAADTGDSMASDPLSLQQAILGCQLERENAALRTAGPAAFIYCDRGVGDHFGYLSYHGLPAFSGLVAAWNEARERYRAVFFLHPNPSYESAPHRRESANAARRLHTILLAGYQAHHPNVVEVPWMPVGERLRFVEDESRSYLAAAEAGWTGKECAPMEVPERESP